MAIPLRSNMDLASLLWAYQVGFYTVLSLEELQLETISSYNVLYIV